MINFFTKKFVKRFKNMIKRLFYEKNTNSRKIFIKKSYLTLNLANFPSKILLWKMKVKQEGNRFPYT